MVRWLEVGEAYTVVMVGMPDVIENNCHCGRELRLLNQASDTPKCVGCGKLDELCQCEVQA